MRTIADLLAAHPFFRGFDPPTLEMVAGCATNVHFADGALVAREGQPADRFYVVRNGRLALELASPGHNRLILDTADDGDVVGWEWLVAPHRMLYDVRAVAPTSAVALDGACLRGKCAGDAQLGYAFMQRVSQVMFHQLSASRIRLLDLYGRPA